jgi:hypothetical protein
MNIQDLMEDVKNLRGWEFERRLHKLIRENYKYKNLDKGNQKLIMDLVKKYKPYLLKGIGISSLRIRDEMIKLRRNRLKLDLTENDLRDIKEILKMFIKK